MKRRHFLQSAASTLTTLGVSQLNLQRKSIQYGKALAQSTSRKLALLVGINKYPRSQRFTNLYGCLNDVELQRQLLIHRFGFQDSDICVLVDETENPPTRNNILTAFEEHLIKQARKDDVVVFHFSGHGSQILDNYPLCGTQLFNSTFVPADDLPSSTNVVHDIMGRSLFLLMSRIKSQNLTVVLDSCFSGGGTRGNVRIRAISGSEYQPSQAEREFQEKQLSYLSYGLEELERLRCEGVAKGVVLAAAERVQEAADVTFDGEAKDAAFSDFDAGAFTYFLTQHLWNQTDSVRGTIATTERHLRSYGIHQTPLHDVEVNSGFEAKSTYFLDDVHVPPSDATILSVENNRALIWLGGINPDTLEALQTGSRFSQSNTEPQQEAILVNRNGLFGWVLISNPELKSGSLNEISRVIPKDFKLRIGIDPSIRDKKNHAEEQLRLLPRIEPVHFQLRNTTCFDLHQGLSSEIPYAKSIQYIISRMTPCYHEFFQSRKLENIPEINSIGLFSQDLDEIIPDSFHIPNESINDAIRRLRSKLIALVAARIIKLTLNARSSQLHLEAVIKLEENPSEEELNQAFKGNVCESAIGENIAQTGKIIAQAFTTRNEIFSRNTIPLSHQIPLCNLYYLEITNHEPKDLYVTVLGVASSGEIAILFPNTWSGFEQDPKIEAHSTIKLPNPLIGDNFALFFDKQGIGEILIIASISPLSRTRRYLQLLTAEVPKAQRSFVVPSVEVISNLLNDIDGTRGESSDNQSFSTIYSSEIASFSITFEAI